jgi:hypothetical protein
LAVQLDLKGALEFLGAASALAALAFGLYQYYVAQKWKRAEFAAAQLEALSTDEELDLCCKLLDWAGRVSGVPLKYQALTDQKTFVHDWRVMKQAMLPEEDSERADWDWQHMMYRDIFDRFFSYLERIDQYIAIDLISPRDVASLRYWLAQIERPRFLPEDEQSLFARFIERYGYSGVRSLARRLAAVSNPEGLGVATKKNT